MSTSPPPEPPTSRHVDACGHTHPGRQREQNEDAFRVFLDERLFILADGMGGRASGDIASQMAVEELNRFFRAFRAAPRNVWPFPVDKSVSLGANLLRVGIKVANQRIREAAAADPVKHRMGCTLACLAIGETQLIAAHVGDVRIYRFRDGRSQRITRDHSILEEMLAAKPDMTKDEIAAMAPRNLVTKALGSKEDLEPTVYVNAFAPGDMYLICSDGLWGSVEDDRIAAIVTETHDIEAACQALVDAANEAGGPDNITAILLRVS